MKKRPGSKADKVARTRKARIAAMLSGGALLLLGLGFWLVQQHLQATVNRPSEPFVTRRDGPLTYNRDIAPIIFGHCTPCHRPGESAPFNLVTFQDVKARTADIVAVTGRRYMPPWLPSRAGLPLAEERRLSDAEIEAIQQWVREGAAEGAASGRPAPPTWPDGWQLGPPDLVVEMPEAYTLPPGGRDVYRNFVIPMPVKARRFVRAVEFKADTRVLHHVFIRFDRSQQSRRLDAQDAEVGFGGIALPPTAESAGGHFLSWQPGRGPTRFPEGLSWALEPNRDLILQAHLQPSGKPEKVRPRIGFYFTDRAPTNTPFKLALSSIDIDIPAGASGYEVRDSYTLPADVDLLAVLPHAHYLAREIQGLAILPSGETRTLIEIKEWDFNWQSDYRFLDPVFLPKGTRLDLRIAYDNSKKNIRNPHQPPIRVGYGLQSGDEMGELWMQMLPRSADDRRKLELDWEKRLVREIIAYNQHALRQNPTNAHAMVQLAKALMTSGHPTEAAEHLGRAVQIDHNEEEGHYHIGVLTMDRDPATAESAFLETIRINPENFKARNNLGLVLMRTGRLLEAEAQFKVALELNPGDRIVMDNLALIRRRTGRP